MKDVGGNMHLWQLSEACNMIEGPLSWDKGFREGCQVSIHISYSAD
jgi:hypothetical protein